MAALSWLMNMGFAAGGAGGGEPEPPATVFLESVCDGQSVNIDGSVREDRFSVGSEGVRTRRQIS